MSIPTIRRCAPKDIFAQVKLIRGIVGTGDGGLMIFASPSRDVPLENIEAICAAWEKYCV